MARNAGKLVVLIGGEAFVLVCLTVAEIGKLILVNNIIVEMLGVFVLQISVVVIVEVLFQIDFVLIHVKHLHVQTEGLKLLDKDLEGFGNTRLGNILTLDNSFVGLDTSRS